MMVRSGIIIPFQFRDCKKLLMIGVPEENRDLNIWDLKNVVRAAFGIYNFEFRNKKIGFNIPDELLLHYLAQRRDLTNFVIEIGLNNDDGNAGKELLSFEPSCSQKLNIVPIPQRSSESVHSDGIAQHPYNFSIAGVHGRQLKSPTLAGEQTNQSDHSSRDEQPPNKLMIAQIHEGHTPESMTQSIDPMDIIPKSENDEAEMDIGDVKYQIRELHRQQQQQQQHILQQQQPHQQGALQSPDEQTPLMPTLSQHQHQHPQLQLPQQHHSPFFMPNYNHGSPSSHNNPQPQPTATPLPHTTTHQTQGCSPAMMSRFRRRGERMSKDQKELYVKYFEENPCMLTQRRNDIMLEPHWNKLASMLNSVPQGAAKNVEEWKQTFDAWRYRVFMYTRYNSKLVGSAAQNPKNYKPLTPTDQRAYAMWTSHKNTTPQDYEKMDMFTNLDETQTEYDY